MSDAIARHRKFEEQKKKHGLTDKKLNVLFDLKKHGASSYRQIAARCECVQATLLRYVQELRKAGFVERAYGPDDFRTAFFSLSKKGDRLVSGLLAVLD